MKKNYKRNVVIRLKITLKLYLRPEEQQIFIRTLVRMAPSPDGTIPADHTIHSRNQIIKFCRRKIFILSNVHKKYLCRSST